MKLRNIRKDQAGITGLETAIILIAFVMVASVFAYVVLSAGLFSSQKAKEAVNSGLEQTSSTVELKGSVVATMEDSVVTEISFTVGLVPGGGSVDMTDTSEGENKVVISYSDAYHQYPSLDWTMEQVNAGNDDSVLAQGELFKIVVDMTAVNDGAANDDEKLGAYHTFMLELKPPDGAVLTIERTVPARVAQIVNLH